MLEIAIILYCIYFIINVSLAIFQINYVSAVQHDKAVVLEQDKYKEAASYSIKSQKISLMSIVYDFVLFFAWIGFGLAVLSNITADLSGWQKTIVFLDLFIVINWVLSLPFSLYSTFKLDKEYNFSNMTWSLYIKDALKGAIIFFIVGNLVIGILSMIIEFVPFWWIWGFLFIFAVIILINMLYPIFRAKVYDKFDSLKDKELEEKIENLLTQVGFKSSGVFSVDASKRDNRLNAYFGGLGSTKRVVLFDTLIEKLSHNELLAVLAHELGHFKNKDIIKNISIMGFVMFVFFAIFGNLSPEFFYSLGMENKPYAIITAFMIFSPILSFFLTPLISSISRHNEYAADKFSTELSSSDDLISALLKLANENKSFPLSHKYYIFFHYTHPPLVERLKQLGHKI